MIRKMGEGLKGPFWPKPLTCLYQIIFKRNKIIDVIE